MLISGNESDLNENLRKQKSSPRFLTSKVQSFSKIKIIDPNKNSPAAEDSSSKRDSERSSKGAVPQILKKQEEVKTQKPEKKIFKRKNIFMKAKGHKKVIRLGGNNPVDQKN